MVDAVLWNLNEGLVSEHENMINGGNDEDDMNEHMHAAVFPLVEEQTCSDAPWLFDTLKFVQHFDSVHVVRNSALARFGPSS